MSIVNFKNTGTNLFIAKGLTVITCANQAFGCYLIHLYMRAE